MEVKVLEVEETFLIENRGLVVAGTLENNAPNFKIGDKIKFCCSDDSTIFSEVAGLEISKFNSAESRYNFYKSNKFAFSVRNVDDKKEILKGASVFLMK